MGGEESALTSNDCRVSNSEEQNCKGLSFSRRAKSVHLRATERQNLK